MASLFFHLLFLPEVFPGSSCSSQIKNGAIHIDYVNPVCIDTNRSLKYKFIIIIIHKYKYTYSIYKFSFYNI